MAVRIDLSPADLQGGSAAVAAVGQRRRAPGGRPGCLVSADRELEKAGWAGRCDTGRGSGGGELRKTRKKGGSAGTEAEAAAAGRGGTVGAWGRRLTPAQSGVQSEGFRVLGRGDAEPLDQLHQGPKNRVMEGPGGSDRSIKGRNKSVMES